jgi:hypothetical protein
MLADTFTHRAPGGQAKRQGQPGEAIHHERRGGAILNDGPTVIRSCPQSSRPPGPPQPVAAQNHRLPPPATPHYLPSAGGFCYNAA